MFEISEEIGRYLQNMLPGERAQRFMAPVPVDGTRPIVKPRKTSRKSAVLSLLLPSVSGRDIDLLLTVRNRNLDYHAGQISFPGGMIEEGESPIEAALREAHEEVGISPDDITVLGTLTELYVSPSDNLITPVVGFMNYRPDFKLQEEEVEEVFTVDVNYLMNAENIKKEQWDLRGYQLHVPYWKIHEVPLWGATAMMCSELMEVLRKCRR